MYLTYDEYRQWGGTLDENDFALLEIRCRKRVDRWTLGRLMEADSVPLVVKQVMMGLVQMEESIGVWGQMKSPRPDSFTTDGYSESYGGRFGYSQVEKEMDDLVRRSLVYELDPEGEHLLYQGVE